jgi:uncharacterized integral membrane protein
MSFENTDQGGDGRGFQLPSLKLVLLLIVVIGIAIFFFQNPEDVPITFFWKEVNWPLRLVIFMSVIAGVIIDRLGGYFWARSRRKNRADG